MRVWSQRERYGEVRVRLAGTGQGESAAGGAALLLFGRTNMHEFPGSSQKGNHS